MRAAGVKIPVPPADSTTAPGEQYREWLDATCESNPDVYPDDMILAVRAGEPGPDGVVRNYPVYSDAFDLLQVCLAESSDSAVAPR